MSRYGVGLLTMSGVLLVALAMPGAGPAPPAEGQEAFVPAKFIAVDTSRLMGLPDSHEVYGVEAAFPHLTFERPVDFTHAGDGSCSEVTRLEVVAPVDLGDGETAEAPDHL